MALRAWHLVALATALAFALARYQLGSESFWEGEFITWRWAHLPLTEIWPYAAHRFHPPLYFWFMHGWIGVGPSPDEVWLRLPSAIFFALTVPMVYVIGRVLGGTTRAGVYAAFLAATAPFLLRWGQWARPYAMVSFFAACGFAAAACILRGYREETRPRLIGAGLAEACGRLARGQYMWGGTLVPPTPPGRPPHPRGAPHTPGLWRALRGDGAWMAYIVSSAVVMWLHNTAGLFPVVTGLILLCAIWAVPSYRGLRFVNLCIAMAAIAVLYSPQVPHLLSGMTRMSTTFYLAPDAGWILDMFRQVYGGAPGVTGAFALILLTLLFAIAVAVSAKRGRWEWVAFVLLGWLLAPALLIVFSFWKPVLQHKLMIWTLAPFLATCGAGLGLVPWTPVRAAALAALLALNVHGITREWESVRQDWRGVVRALPQDISPDATMLICPRWYLYLFRHYWEREGRDDVKLHFIDILGGRQEIFEIVGYDDRGPEVSLAQLARTYPEIWAIWTSNCFGQMGFLETALEKKEPIRRVKGVAVRLYGKRE